MTYEGVSLVSLALGLFLGGVVLGIIMFVVFEELVLTMSPLIKDRIAKRSQGIGATQQFDRTVDIYNRARDIAGLPEIPEK